MGGGDWTQFRHSPLGGASENPGVFTTAEAANLTPLWSIAGHPADDTLGQYVYAQALITADTIYFTTASAAAKVVALNANTKEVRWSRAFPGDINPGCGTYGPPPIRPGIWASPALAGGVLYIASPDGRIYALSPADGSTIWSVQVADPTPAGRGQFIESSPAVSIALDKLYVGIASTDGCAEIAGRVASVDLTTHAVQYVDLDPAGHFGSAVWTSISIDEAAGAVYATSGNGKHPEPLASTPHTQSFLKLSAADLHVLDGWQNPCSLTDCDFGASPTLFNAGDGTPLVAATSKDGYLYVLNRAGLSAGYRWRYQLGLVDPAHATEGANGTAGWGTLSTPTFAHGTLYAAGGHTPQGEVGSVVAFEPGTGAVKWKHVTPGYVLTSMPAVGDVLLVESSSPDNSQSWLEVLDQATGTQLKIFNSPMATYAAPSVGHGMIIWSDAVGHVTALVVPHYR